MIPPEQNAEFVAGMEHVLDMYAQPYDPKRPLVCVDEKPYQLIGETRIPIPAAPGRVERFDYEYKRNGTANIFMAIEPLAGWRRIEITEHRTKVDFANFLKQLVDENYPEAEVIRLVMDNLSTHTMGALYEAFPASEARRIASRIEIHYTPKHGSWLNVAEIEIASLEKQCLDRRIPEFDTLRREGKAWEESRNAECVKVNWQYSTSDARTKLKRLYPKFKA